MVGQELVFCNEVVHGLKSVLMGMGLFWNCEWLFAFQRIQVVDECTSEKCWLDILAHSKMEDRRS